MPAFKFSLAWNEYGLDKIPSYLPKFNIVDTKCRTDRNMSELVSFIETFVEVVRIGLIGSWCLFSKQLVDYITRVYTVPERVEAGVGE